MLASMKRRMTNKTAQTGNAASKREALRQFREHFDLSLENLADQSGLSRSMLSKFELGQRDLSSEAWMRVVATIQRRFAEDDARRKQEREKAVQTAGILGVPLTGILAELNFSSADLEKEHARLAKSAELNNLLGHELENLTAVEKSKVLRQLKGDPKVAKQLLEHYLALIEWRQKILDLEAKGYALMPKSVEEERDQLKARVAELEQEWKPPADSRAVYDAAFAAHYSGALSQLQAIRELLSQKGIDIDDPRVCEIFESFRREIAALGARNKPGD